MELTQLLEDLAKAGAGRKAASKTLVERVAEVADAIASAGAPGDKVTVYGEKGSADFGTTPIFTYEIVRLYAEGQEGPGWPVLVNPQGFKALVTDRRVLSEIEGWSDGRNWQDETGVCYDRPMDMDNEYRAATAVQCVAFAGVAGKVIEAFAGLCIVDTSEYRRAAELVAKATV